MQYTYQQPPQQAMGAGAPPRQRSSGGRGGEQFACHRCGAVFGDAVALVEHDGRCAAGGASSACVLS
jgi:hypothetical protein